MGKIVEYKAILDKEYSIKNTSLRLKLHEAAYKSGQKLYGISTNGIANGFGFRFKEHIINAIEDKIKYFESRKKKEIVQALQKFLQDIQKLEID